MSKGRTDLIVVGKVVDCHGVRGWLKVRSFMQNGVDILNHSMWELLKSHNPPKQIKLIQGRVQGKSLLVKLDGVDDRDSATALIGYEVNIQCSKLPVLAPGQYYWSELLGLKVVNSKGQSLGIVDQVMETGANDVMLLKHDDGRERAVPFITEVVNGVYPEQGYLEVDWDADF